MKFAQVPSKWRKKYNKEIIDISLEFVEMVIKISSSKKKSKTYWVTKTSEKILKLLQAQQHDHEILVNTILEEKKREQLKWKEELTNKFRSKIPYGAKDQSMWIDEIIEIINE